MKTRPTDDKLRPMLAALSKHIEGLLNGMGFIMLVFDPKDTGSDTIFLSNSHDIARNLHILQTAVEGMKKQSQ